MQGAEEEEEGEEEEGEEEDEERMDDGPGTEATPIVIGSDSESDASPVRFTIKVETSDDEVCALSLSHTDTQAHRHTDTHIYIYSIFPLLPSSR